MSNRPSVIVKIASQEPLRIDDIEGVGLRKVSRENDGGRMIEAAKIETEIPFCRLGNVGIGELLGEIAEIDGEDPGDAELRDALEPRIPFIIERRSTD